MIRIIRVSLFVASNSVVSRGLVQAYGKINQAVGKKNYLDNSVERKRPVHHFTRNELWKCIGCILSKVTYEIKGHLIFEKLNNISVRRGRTPIHRDVLGKKYLLKLSCYIYIPQYCYACR